VDTVQVMYRDGQHKWTQCKWTQVGSVGGHSASDVTQVGSISGHSASGRRWSA